MIDAYRRINDIDTLRNTYIERINNHRFSAKANILRLKSLTLLFGSPIISIPLLAEELAVSYNTANQIIKDFIAMDILEENRTSKRNKLFTCQQYLNALEHEYE